MRKMEAEVVVRLVNIEGLDEEQRKIDELYGLLRAEGTKDCLKDMEKRTTCRTPLHKAADAGMSHLALEVANLKPSLTRKLNHEGLSPMHLVLNKGHIQTVRALVAFDSSLIRVKGRDLATPLHYATKLGETELLAEFLSACPSSVEDLTSRCETAMHVAVRNKRLDACEVLLGWMIRKNVAEILSWKDEDGNTVLHIAALTNQSNVMKLLIGYVKVNAMNFAGLTALDLCFGEGHRLDLNVEIRKTLCDAKARRASEVSDSLKGAGYLSQTKLSLMEKWGQILRLTRAELREMTLVVAVLIATATYQGVLSPPGGYWQDDSAAAAGSSYTTSPALADATGGGPPHIAGKMIMSGVDRAYFLLLNSFAFVSSVIIIMLTLLGMESALMLITPVAIAMVTYALAMNQAATDKEAKVFVPAAFVVAVALAVAYIAALWSLGKLIKRKARLDVPGRRIGGFI